MIDLRKFFEKFDGNPHQLAAIDILQSQMPPTLLESDAEWVDCFQVECEIIDTAPKRIRKEWQ